MKYRSRFDIIGVMLQAAVGGATKTRLMYEAFLSHNQVQEYISFLLEKKLISLGADKKRYLPTEKGQRFLAMYAEIKDAVAVEMTRPVSKMEPQPSVNLGIDEAKPGLGQTMAEQRSQLSMAQPSQRQPPRGAD